MISGRCTCGSALKCSFILFRAEKIVNILCTSTATNGKNAAKNNVAYIIPTTSKIREAIENLRAIKH